MIPSIHIVSTHTTSCDYREMHRATIVVIIISYVIFKKGLKGGKGPWWSALGPPGALRKCQEMPTVS